MQSVRPSVLIVDDDPSHLEIYGLLVSQAGYEPVPALVRFCGPDDPSDREINLVLLDYRLDSIKTSAEIAEEVRGQYPAAPILLLSDIWSMPPDIAPYITESARNGDPAFVRAQSALPPDRRHVAPWRLHDLPFFWPPVLSLVRLNSLRRAEACTTPSM